MMLSRGKQSKSETPSRFIHPLQRPAPLLQNGKKSDPFLKELREVYDKQNIHPNVKENRTRSHHNNNAAENKSPVKKVMNLKQLHKNTTRPIDSLNSHSKYSQSSELQRVAVKSRSSNRKSTEKDDPQLHLQDEYFPVREERREKKMKVTLKDLKRQRRSVQESDGEYGKANGDTRESITQDTAKADSHKAQFAGNQHGREEVIVPVFEPESRPESRPQEQFCRNHPEKRATHQLLDASSTAHTFCEKCAVTLATRGFQMGQIGSGQGEVREERICELKDFLFELDKMEPLFKRTARRIEGYRAFLVGKLEEEGKRLEIYYNNLTSVVRNSYDLAMGTLKLHYDAVLEEIDQQALAVDARAQEVANLKEDILPNIGSIVEAGRVTCESFRSVLNYNYGRLAEAEQLICEVGGFTCTYYQYRFENVEHLLVDLRSLVSPALEALLFEPAFDTERKGGAGGEWCDPFRMSFGKQNGSAFRF